MKQLLPCLIVAASFAASSPARAADAPPAGVVNLMSSASVEVAKDWMTATLSVTRDGPDANVVQSGLKQALDTALAEARKVAKPGQVEVQTGNFSMFPRYSKSGPISGWQGSAELMFEGRDMLAISQLVGRIGSMTVARVMYGLSREQREKAEGDVAAQAIVRYRAKAAEYARQFGYSAYAIREVNVSTNEPQMGIPMQVMRNRAMSSASAEEALPVEVGKALVTVNVNGSVQLSK